MFGTLFSRIAIVIGLFVCFFLLWPNFKVVTTCGANQDFKGQGCVVANTYDYSDFELGGGLRLIQEQNICLNNGKFCLPDVDGSKERRYPAFGLIGSFILSACASLFIFRR